MTSLHAPVVRRGLASFVVGAALVAAPATGGGTAPVKWWRYDKDPHWVQGNVVVDAKPSQVWSRVSNVASWPSTFSDIKSMKIVSHSGATWNLKMETHTFDCGTHPYEVTIKDKRTIKLRIDAPGVDAIAYLSVRDGAIADTSFVTYDLFVDVSFPASWFVSEEKLHAKQESMVVRNLTDVWKAFAKPKS